MSEYIAVSGIIGTVPRRSATKGGVPLTSFRLAARQGHFDRAKAEWVEDDSSWYSVTTFRQLATNAADSLQKGEHVLVAGRLIIREWTAGDRSGVDVEIVADSVGHDLSWYTTSALRSKVPARVSANSFSANSFSANSFSSDSSGSDSSGSDLSGADQFGAPPVELTSPREAAAVDEAPEDLTMTSLRSGDGFVPIETDADREEYARLDS